MVIHLKKIDVTLTMPPKIKSVVPSYVPLRFKQLLSETFFLPLTFR